MKNAIFKYRAKCCFIQERTRIWQRNQKIRLDYYMYFFLKEFNAFKDHLENPNRSDVTIEDYDLTK